MKSKVYFADTHAKFGDSLIEKFERFIVAAGIDDMDVKDKLVAVKIHFGEWGNLSFLRHQYARVLCEHLKKNGARVFLTDANTLYPGYRGNAVDHLECASWNGYNQLSAGAPIIIADGLRGTDERCIPVEGGELVKEAKIGAAIAEADVIISMAHAKGHAEAGFGGCLKNLGMGSGSKKGKMEMHSSGTPEIDTDLCVGCGSCQKNCANGGVSIINKKAVINEDKCLGCGYCFAYCPKGAINCKWDEAPDNLNKKITEYAKATINGKPNLNINIAIDIQGSCDCNGAHSAALAADAGFFASTDPIAVDQATIDAINKETGDVFTKRHPHTDWSVQLSHGEKLGMGSREYELVEVK